MSETSNLDEFNRIVDGQFPGHEELMQQAIQDPEVQNYLRFMSYGEDVNPNMHSEFTAYIAEHYHLSKLDASNIFEAYLNEQRVNHG